MNEELAPWIWQTTLMKKEKSLLSAMKSKQTLEKF